MRLAVVALLLLLEGCTSAEVGSSMRCECPAGLMQCELNGTRTEVKGPG